jgi:hypothetical protein
MKRKITRAAITEYSISDEIVRTVSGSVKIIIRIRKKERVPLSKILLRIFFFLSFAV